MDIVGTTVAVGAEVGVGWSVGEGIGVIDGTGVRVGNIGGVRTVGGGVAVNVVDVHEHSTSNIKSKSRPFRMYGIILQTGCEQLK